MTTSSEEQSDDEIASAMIEELQRVAEEIGQPPTKTQFDEHSTHNPEAFVSEFGKWVDALRRANLNPSDAQAGRQKTSKEELLGELTRLRDEIGRVPQVSDMNARGEYSASTYRRRFGGWREALTEAGMAPDDVQQVSREELVEEMQRVGEEIGHPPRTEHMDQNGEYSSTTYQDRFGSWKEALEAAGFAPFAGISEEELLAVVTELAEEIGRPPTTTEFNEQTPHSSSTCKEKFGSWQETIEQAGLDSEESGRQEYSDEQLRSEMQRLDDDLERAPTSRDMDDEGAYSAGVYQNRFGSWEEALSEAGVEAEQEPRRKYTNEELVDELRRVRDEIDQPPRATDMETHGDISPSTYLDRFGSWEEAISEAGLNPDDTSSGKQYRDEELLDELVRLHNEFDRPPTTVEMESDGRYSASVYLNRFGSWDEALTAAGLDSEEKRGDRQHTDDELLDEIRRLAEKVDGIPTTNDMDEYGKYSYETYISRFGSWKGAIENAEVDEN